MDNNTIIKNIDIAIKAALGAGIKILEVYNSDNFEIEIKNDDSPLTIADKKANDFIIDLLLETNLPILSEEGKEIPYDERKSWNYFWLVDPLDGTKEFIKRNGEFTVNIALIEKNKPVAGVIFVPVLRQLYVGINNIGAFLYENVNINDNYTFESLKISGIKLPFKKNENEITIVGSRTHMNLETEKFISELKHRYNKVNIMPIGSSLKICMVAEGKADIYPRFGPTMEWDTAAGHAIAIASGTVFTKHDGSEMIYNKSNLLNPWFVVKAKGSVI